MDIFDVHKVRRAFLKQAPGIQVLQIIIMVPLEIFPEKGCLAALPCPGKDQNRKTFPVFARNFYDVPLSCP
jgi:hypothetical protein